MFKLPQPDERLTNTPQLVCCLGLLQASQSPDDILEPMAHTWMQSIEKDADEQERLHALSIKVIRAFMKDELKDAKAIAEVVCLAPILNKDAFHDLLREFYSGIHHSGLLNFHHLEGLAQLIQGADTGHLNADDLVKILELLSSRLRDTHQQSVHNMYQLTMAVSHVLDAMADTKVTGLDRKTLHEPLSAYLGELMKSKDPFLVYQAAYACQALLCVPDNETTWQAAMRRTGKVIQGVSGLVSAVKGLDLERFVDGLSNIQQGIDGVSKVFDVVKTAYVGVASLTHSGHGLLVSLKEGLSFERKREWYAALRGADILIRDGELAALKKLVCGAPCRYDAAFQWGICQRLGEMAANPMWDAVTRRGAIAFLGEIYRDDDMWGQCTSVKQWILNILMQLTFASSSGSGSSGSQLHAIVAEKLLQDLEVCGDPKKLELYRECRANGPFAYPLKISLPEFGSPSLLDRVQNRPDVEGNIRVLRKHRTKDRRNAVYIPPQAKANIQAPDDARFPLMENVGAFLGSEQKVFLLIGDSGAGKSTFNRELEFELWQAYENKTGRIPLHINLPAIEKPEHDMIAKQLRKAEFSEPQIREMKHHRKFILICDGYDESQQTHNLYVTNKLNQDGEWDAQMVISCRSEYIGADYRDRFQPGGDRNTWSDSLLFQEAVITPFTMDQVKDYIQQYVTIHQPLWRVEDYKQALELIPSLKELVKNPFLMTLSLDVLPRMVDPGEHLSTTRVTRVALYDHFVEQWLERGKKRLGEKDMGRQTKAAFEKLSAEGFTVNGIEYLKRLAVAIYKEQGGNPVVEYTQLVDESSWKDEFFERKHKQLLLEASPLTRTGNQHRFIHRSVLEYAVARAVFDPLDRKNRGVVAQFHRRRRGSIGSTLSFEAEDLPGQEVITKDREPDPHSPLVWRSFVNDHSLLQFLEERVQQEPLFKRQLLAYIEHSKKDKKWRKAAANAITVLARSGVQFYGTDLRGIQIPGADLSYGMFDSAQLQGADMRKVSLRGIWMRHTDLSEAQMEGVQFGELPYLSEEKEVRSCTYSPDGKSFAVGLETGEITVYAVSNWEQVMTLVGHTNEVRCVMYSPTGGQIASGSCDGTARLWDVGTGACQQVIEESSDVSCVAYSPREDQIALGNYDSELKLMDLATGEFLFTLTGHDDGVACAAYSPQGDKIGSGSFDYTIRLWDTRTGNCTHIVVGHDNYVWSLAFSPSGDQFVSASYDWTVRIWDTESGARRHILAGHSDAVSGVAYSPKGDHVASCSYDGTVRIWDVETGAVVQTFTGHGSSVRSVVYSPQGNHVASGSEDKTVRLWDVSVEASRFSTSHRNTAEFKVEWTPKADQFVSYSGSTIRLLSVDTGACQKTLHGHSTAISSLAISPQGNTIVAHDNHRAVLLWNVDSGASQPFFTAEGPTYINPLFAFSPQGNTIACAGSNMKLQLWDVATGSRRIETAMGHSDRVQCIAFSPTGHLIATASRDGTVRLWDVELLSLRHTLNCFSYIYGVVFSPRGHRLACTSSDKRIRLWDVETGDCQLILMGHDTKGPCMAYSWNGDILVTGDEIIRLWDVESGQCRAIIRDIHGAVAGVM
ncbi:hypothetical protein BGX31_001181 [Mortierella sp. GBA43]|nr:hypothetical protein BGX31_001181 [Mortierella sp. GBA43]